MKEGELNLLSLNGAITECQAQQACKPLASALCYLIDNGITEFEFTVPNINIFAFNNSRRLIFPPRLPI